MPTFKLLLRDIWAGLELGELKGFEEDFLLGGGESVAKSYPKKCATYAVNKSPVTRPGPERPGRAGKMKASDKLTDLLHGGDSTVLVVSARLKEVLAAAERKVEFLPVTISGHTEPYFIANVLDHVACLDIKRSGAKLIGDEVASVKKLVLREDALPKSRSLFQVKEYRDLFLVSERLAADIKDAALTGLEIIETNAYVQGM